MTEVSVVIPCRNAGAYLAPAIRSVLDQTHPPSEIIVVDNGSTDGSRAVAEGFGAAVRVISEPGEGAAAARRAGVAEAAGSALMFLDADDLLGPSVLASLTEALADRPEAVAICRWMRFRESGGCWVAEPASCAPRRPGQDDLAAWLTGWYHPPCSVLWSRAAYERSGGWDPAVRVNNDGDVMMRGLVRGNRLVRARSGTAYYRRLPGDAVSLSGTRHTRPGVVSKLDVLDRIGRMLDERQALDAYAEPLSEAYSTIAEGCRGSCPDLHERAGAAAAALHGRRPPILHRVVRRFRAAAARPAAVQPRSRASGPVTRGDAEAPPSPAHDGPAVSVVIPTYNRAASLARAIDSVLGQSYGDLELLVVDDGSTDGTAELAAQYRDPRVRYLPQDRNRGVAAARNRGIEEARGRFIAFLDSDDEWLPAKLERQMELFEAGTGRLGLVYSGVENVTGTRRRAVPARARGDLFERMLRVNLLHGGGSNIVIRRSVIDTVGLFDTTLPAIEDYDLWLRICRFYEVDCVPEPLIRYHDATPAMADERRSRRFHANIEARSRFHQRYRHDMRLAGVEHLFLLDSAERHLASADGSRRAALRLMLKALKARPGAVGTYYRVPMALLPGRLREPARHGTRRLRAHLRKRPLALGAK